MNKLVFGLLGVLALGASAVPSVAAPLALRSDSAPVTTAVFHADGADARVQTVQYRHESYRHRPPHHRHYRHSRHHRHYFHGR